MEKYNVGDFSAVLQDEEDELFGSKITLGPNDVWLPRGNAPVGEQVTGVCTCGAASVGAGIHSDWCELSGEV